MIDKATGELVQRATYQPYGGADSDYRPPRWHGIAADRRFVGDEEDDEVGLAYFGERYYQPSLGRWLSADPLAVHGLASDPNPYAYVSGAVSTASDPTGLDESCLGFECTSGAGGNVGGGSGGIQIGIGQPPPAPPTPPGGWRPPSPTPSRATLPAPAPVAPPNGGFVVAVERLDRAVISPLRGIVYVTNIPALAVAAYINPEQTFWDVVGPAANLVGAVLGGNFIDVHGPVVPHRDPINGSMIVGVLSVMPGPGAAAAGAEGQALAVIGPPGKAGAIIITKFNRVPYNFSRAEQAAYSQPPGTLCPTCQARPVAEGGHATPAVQMQLAADVGIITEQEARAIARSESNFISLCRDCNLAQGSKLMGNQPGHWMPPNPTTPLIDYLRSIGAIQ